MNINPSWKRTTIIDIKHQDIYDIYIDENGNEYDLSGNKISVSYLLNYIPNQIIQISNSISIDIDNQDIITNNK